MKVTLNWLKQYVAFDWSPEELAERLTMIGIEVEGMQRLGGEFEGVVVAQVITRDRHPNADRLSLCRVADGTGERQIVCGAQNFQAGDKVPLILPGAALPPKPGDTAPFIIKVGKIRGVESQGMMCSPQELGLASDADGLLILPADAVVGQPFAEHLGRQGADVVYDLEITPNRPDLNSVVGIAREISAVTGNPLRLPEITLPAPAGAPTADAVAVRLDAPDLCPRYSAHIVRGVKVGPSPAWLRQSLEKVGIRSISNVVDVTNFVMLEIGQPLHAFDYHLLTPTAGQRPTIVVRRAQEGEVFVTLDGKSRSLTGEMLLIADETKAVALAGVMGGQNTEINDQTRDVLIESAWFKPQNIRATAKRLELRTDASYRYERGADLGICEWAGRRAAQLILQTAGGELAPGMVDAFPAPPTPKTITLRHQKVADLLGLPLAPADNLRHLQRLGLPVKGAPDAATCEVGVPTFRIDLKQEIDLVEEIARLHGVNNIPSTAPRGAKGAHPYDAVHDDLAAVRRILTGLGLLETQGQTLISDQSPGVTPAAPRQTIPLANPLSSDMNVLRPSLLPGLLDAARHNVSRKNPNLALFELGRVFYQVNGQPKEERRVAFLLTGLRHAPFWSGTERDARCDIYDLKGLLEEFLEQFGFRGLAFQRRAESTSLFLESAVLQLGKNVLGELGQLTPAVARQNDLRDAVFLAELSVDQLLALYRPGARSFKALPSMPSIRRDVAMLVPEATTHEAVLATVRQAKAANLESAQLFDVFRGKNVPAGQKSLAYAFTYRHAERTLTDAEVNSAHEKLLEQFQRQLQAVLREGAA